MLLEYESVWIGSAGRSREAAFWHFELAYIADPPRNLKKGNEKVVEVLL